MPAHGLWAVARFKSSDCFRVLGRIPQPICEDLALHEVTLTRLDLEEHDSDFPLRFASVGVPSLPDLFCESCNNDRGDACDDYDLDPRLVRLEGELNLVLGQHPCIAVIEILVEVAR